MAKLPRTSRLGFRAAALVVTRAARRAARRDERRRPDASLTNDAAPAHDAAANDAGPDVEDASAKPDGGRLFAPDTDGRWRPAPAGWTLHIEDLFGSGSDADRADPWRAARHNLRGAASTTATRNGLCRHRRTSSSTASKRRTSTSRRRWCLLDRPHDDPGREAARRADHLGRDLVSNYRARSFCVEGR